MPLEKILVLYLVLVGHAHLARCLRIPEEFLHHWRVKLLLFLLDARQALRCLNFDGKGLLGRELLILGHQLSLVKIDLACNALIEL